jgi:hypothetical protein
VLLRFLILAATLGFAALAGPAEAGDRKPIFSARDGVAIGGYDVVAFFVEQQARLGKPEHSIMWKGAVWRFVSAENQAWFEANPRAYAPRFGGYCAYGVSQGYLIRGNPTSWQIVDGQLFLLVNDGVHKRWRGQTGSLITQAAGNWPDVLR